MMNQPAPEHHLKRGLLFYTAAGTVGFRSRSEEKRWNTGSKAAELSIKEASEARRQLKFCTGSLQMRPDCRVLGFSLGFRALSEDEVVRHCEL